MSEAEAWLESLMGKASAPVVRHIPVSGPRQVDRDPCGFCGQRGDLPCQRKRRCK